MLDGKGAEKLEGSPLGENLIADGVAELGSSFRISGVKVDGKLRDIQWGSHLVQMEEKR